MYDFFHSSQAIPDGNNPMSFKNPEFDRAVEDLTTNCDENAQMQDAFKAQEIGIDEVCYCPLYYRSMNEAHRTDTFEGWFVQLGGVAGSINYLTPLKKAEEAKPTGIPVAAALIGLAGAAAYLARRKD
jgi:ABC-type transport system substrate-binding protein